jgi:hypothetical protein
MLRATSLWVVAGLAAYLGAAAEVRAQPIAEPALSPGARVRVTVGAPVAERHLGAFSQGARRRLVGTLEAVRADTLVLRGKTVQLVPVDSVRLLEVSRGRHRQTWSGAGVGFAFGAGAGGLLGALASSSCESSECVDPGEFIAGSVVALGVAGGLIGAVVGAATETDTWEEVPLDRLSGVPPAAQGHVVVVPTRAADAAGQGRRGGM